MPDDRLTTGQAYSIMAAVGHRVMPALEVRVIWPPEELPGWPRWPYASDGIMLRFQPHQLPRWANKDGRLGVTTQIIASVN